MVSALMKLLCKDTFTVLGLAFRPVKGLIFVLRRGKRLLWEFPLWLFRFYLNAYRS